MSHDDLLDIRRAKAEQWKGFGFAANNPSTLALTTVFSCLTEIRCDTQHLESQGKPVTQQILSSTVAVAGRIMLSRGQGKLRFMRLRDESGEIQLFLSKANFEEKFWEIFKTIDLGDIVEVSGKLMITSTGEPSIEVKDFRPLVKALIPPNKHDTVTDVELRYRQRYVDLIENKSSREVFKARSLIISQVRRIMENNGFMEVETPTLVPLRSGATARPFETHHNALDADLYLRVAPELYLKRLLVGGYQRVFEIGKSFRNEGVSTRHNPEFTMIEAYEAFDDYNKGMDYIADIIRRVDLEVLSHWPEFKTERTFSFTESGSFIRVTMDEAIRDALVEKDQKLADVYTRRAWSEFTELPAGCDTPGKIMYHLFETYAEPNLTLRYQNTYTGVSYPVFIKDFPVEMSPLARPMPTEKNYIPGVELTERYELFIDGKEIANGFSELNDPDMQLERFKAQAVNRANGDDEAMDIDEDYITALSHGMPPAQGFGIGLDRICMLLTNQKSIRDVILFPAMRTL